MLMSEKIKLETEARESALRQERFQGDAESEERSLAAIDEQIAALKQVDKRLVIATPTSCGKP